MSNGDDADENGGEGGDNGGETGAADAPGELSAESLSARLDEAETLFDEAETEADLDQVEVALDGIAADLDSADLPEPEDEDEEGPGAEIERRLEELRGGLEAARGPYASDVTEALEAAESTVRDAEWTDDGEAEMADAVGTFLESADETLGESFDIEGASPDAVAGAIESVRVAVEDAELDSDEDAETIEALVDAADALTAGLDDAEVWSDLTIREQLDAQGFYDVLTPENRKDFPPEWNAIRVYATTGEAEPILMALERYESDFMEENILDALERFAPQEAFEAMEARAERRDKHAIRVLGKIGDDRAGETIAEFLGGGGVELDLVTLRALGAIGSEDATQAVADRLAAENPEIRSTAARALGMIGDTRAVDPLADVLADDDADEVRASAAWALRQIGTQEALDAAAEYADDRSYIVQAEAEKATGA